MKRSHSNEDPADTPNKKSNRNGIGTSNTIQRRINKIQSFYDGLATEKRLKCYQWLPRKGGTKVSREKKVGGASSTNGPELQAVVGQNLEVTSKKTPPSRLVRLDYPPPIPVLADPWAWNDYRTIRCLRQAPHADKQSKSAGPLHEAMDGWRTLEAMGDKMLSVIILTALKCLKLPFPIMAFLHENLSRNDLFRAWAEKDLPDYPDNDIGDKADAYEVIFHPPVSSLPLFCIVLSSY